MGTQTLGNTSSPGTSHFFFESGSSGFSFKADQANYLQAPGSIYIDKIYFWSGTHDGGSAPFSFALYDRSGNKLAETDVNFSYGTGYGWNHGEFSNTKFYHAASGAQFVAAVYSKGQGLQTAGRGDGGAFAEHTGDGFPNPFSVTTNVTTEGSAGFYVTYFPAATVTGYKLSGVATTIAHVGDRLEIDGLSFSSGVTAIDFNGVAADLANMNQFSDTGLNINIPAGATTGPVHITTHAGTATGPTLTIAGARIERSGSLVNTKNIRVVNGGVLKSVVRIRVYRSGSLVDVH